MRLLILVLVGAGTLLADTVVLKNGLELHGQVAADSPSSKTVQVTVDGKTRVIERARIQEIRAGKTAREEYRERADALAADDAPGWYKLGLWARGKKLTLANEAFANVLATAPNHRAARRELGYEMVAGEWVTGTDAQRKKGFVLCGGKWMLPEEADRLMRTGLMKQAPVTAAHRQRAEEIAQALLDEDKGVRAAAAAMLTEVPDGALLRPMKKVLYARDPAMRKLAVKTLGRVGDRTALPWLIRASMYDAEESVRSAAFRSIKGFRDADVFYPYKRALYSKSPRARIMAAQALAALGDLRGMDAILHRVDIGIGESPRANIMVGSQQSFIQDFDVEIAQAAAIGDPIVQTIREGIILDYKVLGGSGEGWIVEERKAYASALSSLAGRDYGQNWNKYREFVAEQR